MFPRRFFKIQFDQGIIEIFNKMSNGETDKDKDVYIIRFSEVLSITKPIESVQAQLVKDCSKKFQWPFYLKTEKRNFELYAPSELER